MKKLKDTTTLMESASYKDRLKAEFYQLSIRIDSLSNMLSLWEKGQLGFVPKCSYDLLKAQLNVMDAYRHILRERAEIEGIYFEEE